MRERMQPGSDVTILVSREGIHIRSLSLYRHLPFFLHVTTLPAILSAITFITKRV